MVLVVREFVRTRDPLIRDPLNTYTLFKLLKKVSVLQLD